MFELVQTEIDGEWYVTCWLFGEPVQSYKLSRRVTKEELDWICESCVKRFSESIENKLLYGKEEQHEN